MNQGITIPYVAADIADTATEPWLTLEQYPISDGGDAANLTDIAAMWHLALSGLSAYTYYAERCPVSVRDGIVTVYLGIYVFPCKQDMQYSLTISGGGLGVMQQRSVVRDLDIVIPFTDSIALDFVPEPDIVLTWQIDAYTELGERIERPEITIEENIIRLSRECFGVLRCVCTTLAHYYPVFLYVTKAVETVDTEAQEASRASCIASCNNRFPDNFNLRMPCITACDTKIKTNRAPNRTEYSITNLQATAQATWMGLEELKNESLSLNIPACVEHLLELCDDGGMKNPALDMDQNDETIPYVYHSTCTGNILSIQYVKSKPRNSIRRR